MADLSDVSDEQIEEIYNELRESFKVSMIAEGVDRDTAERVCLTVDDNVGNLF